MGAGLNCISCALSRGGYLLRAAPAAMGAALFVLASFTTGAVAEDELATTSGPKLTILHSFGTTGTIGNSPDTGLLIGINNVVYGTTVQGGAFNGGTLFSLTPPVAPRKTWALKSLHDFGGTTNDGKGAQGLLTFDDDGAILGTTVFAPSLVYKLSPPIAPKKAWHESFVRLYKCCTDAVTPYGGIIRDVTGVGGTPGALYGASNRGGATTACFGGCGTIFMLTPPVAPSKAWKRVLIHSFRGGKSGSGPYYAPTMDSDGVLYGVVGTGGKNGAGVAYSLTPPVGPKKVWTYKILHNFALKDGEGIPNSPFTIVNHELYGASSIGHMGGPGGAIYKLTVPDTGDAWKKTVLTIFTGDDGSLPAGPMLVGTGGVFYGTTFAGGSINCGVLFKLAPPAAGHTKWKKTTLHDFAGTPDGCNPGNFGLTADAEGTLYGVTGSGGDDNAGTVFSTKP